MRVVTKQDFAAIAARSTAVEKHLGKVIEHGGKAAPAKELPYERGYGAPGHCAPGCDSGYYVGPSILAAGATTSGVILCSTHPYLATGTAPFVTWL